MASPNFQAYDRNLRRLFYASLVDECLKERRRVAFRASIVTNPLDVETQFWAAPHAAAGAGSGT